MEKLKHKCRLSVNINKIATLRNSRGGNIPDLLACARDIISYGAEGITVHPRPDERHIRKTDVYALSELLKKINAKRPKSKKIEFNIEGHPDQNYLNLLKDIRPDQATLVPDPPEVLTSNAGWRVAENSAFLQEVLTTVRSYKIRSSIFIDVFNWSESDTQTLKALRPDRVELYTEKFAADYHDKKRKSTMLRYKLAAREINQLGIQINAGHDLNSQNLKYLLQNIPEIIECSIGHALIADSLYFGLKTTVKSYLREIRLARK